MQKTIFTIIFLIPLNIFSQGFNDSISYYYRTGNYSKLIKYGENEKFKLKKDTNYAILVNNLATAYLEINDYKNAELNYLEELEIVKNKFGEYNRLTARVYRNLGNVYSTEDLNKSEKYFLKAVEILEKGNHTTHKDYTDCLLDLALVYKDLKNYKNVEIIYQALFGLLKSNQVENSLSYHKVLVSYAIFSDEIEDFEKAEELFNQAYILQKKNLDKESTPSFLFTVDIIGKRLNNQQRYVEAQKFYFESLELKRNFYGKQSKEYINSLIDLGISFSQQSNYLKSKTFFEEVNFISKNINNEFSTNNELALKGLASGYRFEGNYEKSEKYYNQLLEINKKSYGIKSKQYVYVLNLLASNYLDKGDYNNAEKLYLRSNELISSENSFEYFENLIEIGNYYLELNNSSNAFKYLTKANNVYEIIKFSEKKTDTAEYMLSRAWQNYFIEIKDYEKALNAALEKVKLTKKNPLFKSLTNGYAKDLSDLALIYSYLRDFENSEKYYFEAYEIKKNIIGKNPRNDCSLLLGIALIYQKKGDYKKAESFFLQSMKILENQLEINNPIYDDILHHISNFYLEYSKPYDVATYLNKLFYVNQNNIFHILSFITHTEYFKFQESQKGKLNLPFSFLKGFPIQYPEINIGSYENELLLKNLSLRNQQRIKNNILKSNDAVLKQQYEQFIANKRHLTKLEELPLTQRPADYDQLKTETESLEKDITRKSSEFAEAKKSLNITWKQIQEKLKPNEVVIDLVAYNFYNKKWTDSIMYGAFVIKKDSKFPKFISLFEEKQLAVLLERNNQAHDSIQSKIINKQYANKAISELFYKPLEAELKNGTTIYLTPAGLAHQINFKALPILENQTFGEKFEIKLLGSSASIVDYKTTAFSNKQPLEFVLYGGIDYNKRVKEEEENENTPQNTLNELATRSDISEFKYLIGTNEEVQRIKTEAEKYNFTTTVYKEKKATEESVKQLDGKANPFVLHLATHGYFFENVKQEVSNSDKSISENPKRNIYSVAEDPMMRSGILLSGANNSWGKTNNETNLDDGILTAKEISNLDLSNCQLVVLSACETGLGDINGSEGVFGLQRAFKMAGVKNIIMSLWKVPDAQTAELFESFYAECFKGKTIYEAFQETQNKMKAKYPPYFWAGFVLLE